MPKIKMPRKSTSIDMTAMCDFTLLLLTFFIMATKFKPPEPVVVRTPSSVSTDQIPEGFVLITMDKDGRTFFSVDNLKAKRAMIEKVNNDKNLGLNEAQIQSFVNGSSIGVPFSMLSSYLSLNPTEQTEFDKKAPGLPVDTTGNFTTNELAYWIAEARYHLEAGGRFAIKADGEAGYPQIQKIIATLGALKIFRFNFITDMKGVPQGTALYEERNANRK
jgi:biopolymer transport protein ExbD